MPELPLPDPCRPSSSSATMKFLTDVCIGYTAPIAKLVPHVIESDSGNRIRVTQCLHGVLQIFHALLHLHELIADLFD